MNTGSILALDPGSEKTAWVLYLDGKPSEWLWTDNIVLVNALAERNRRGENRDETLVIEDITHYGMAVGRDVFETIRWTGRFQQANGGQALYIPRSEVKLHLCGSPRAKDPNVRQALIDRWGGEAKAIGGRKCRTCKGKGWNGRGRPPCDPCGASGYETPPGPLKGISDHVWQALGVAVTAADRNGVNK